MLHDGYGYFVIVQGSCSSKIAQFLINPSKQTKMVILLSFATNNTYGFSFQYTMRKKLDYHSFGVLRF